MNAADARAFIVEHELGAHVAKLTADAPPLAAAQLEALRALIQSPDATTAGSPKPADALTNHGYPRDLRSA